jgi:hypothetical protein
MTLGYLVDTDWAIHWLHVGNIEGLRIESV